MHQYGENAEDTHVCILCAISFCLLSDHKTWHTNYFLHDDNNYYTLKYTYKHVSFAGIVKGIYVHTSYVFDNTTDANKVEKSTM